MERTQELDQASILAFQRDIQQGRLSFGLLKRCTTSHYDLVMAVNRHGDTSFHVAARHGHVELVRQLVQQHGLPLDHVNTDGKTALHEAAQNCQLECVAYLVSAGCQVDALKRADWTPLMLACTRDDLEVVRILVSHGASLKLRNKDGWTPFHIACREGHADIINYLLDIDGVCWDTKSSNGRTPLHTVALHGHTEIAVILHARCQYAVDCIDSCGVSPLMDSVRNDHLEMTRYLAHVCQADLHKEDALGREAVHHACMAGSVGTLEYLIGEGVDVNKPARVGLATPLHYAAKEGQAEVISLLLHHKADVHATDQHGRTALDIARRAWGGEKAVFILEHQISSSS